MAEKSFKKIRCVHAKKNTIHFIPEHMITEAYLKQNQFVVQEFEEKTKTLKEQYEEITGKKAGNKKDETLLKEIEEFKTPTI